MIRRNYPMIGRFRGWFSELGGSFRQYVFAMDREGLPFNRSRWEWIDQASDGESTLVAFGATRNMSVIGTPIFVSAALPPVDGQSASNDAMTIGAGCRQPFVARSVFNIPGMSLGAISGPAVRALSRGAAKAGIWKITGEGGLSSLRLTTGVCSKEDRVARFASAVVHEVESIAHSVGVGEPRPMRRRNVRIVQADGSSIPMNEIYPSYHAGKAPPRFERPPDAGHAPHLY